MAGMIVLNRDSYGSMEKELDLDYIPRRLVLKRWCKDANSGIRVDPDPAVNDDRTFRMRYGALWSTCLYMCHLASETTESYEEAMNVVASLCKAHDNVSLLGGRDRDK
ncbi:hypothetical protein PIB30_056206 [Stylosanthes scabra]|uniref:Uncharacterized protein n=1 Tax=Stylosanthes scabra TaxID=79078 RepID=A0ABU6ZHY5_9FABA|nr:hypothetical protein [Stylosanthes scabra]